MEKLDKRTIVCDIAALPWVIDWTCPTCELDLYGVKIDLVTYDRVAIYCTRIHADVKMIKYIPGITDEILECLSIRSIKDRETSEEREGKNLAQRFQILKQPN